MHLLVFDSGIGGLGVAAEIRRLRPQARMVYLADNAYFPYGEKADADLRPHIVALIGAAIEAIAPCAVVIACNTASTIALDALRQAYRLPFVGCVPPIKPAAAASQTRHIGVLATAATIRRPYLSDLIRTFAPDCTVHSLGTPTLAALAEQKFRGAAVDVAGAIAPLFAEPGGEQIDAMALGCTHYSFLLPELQAAHPGIAWFDPAGPVARQSIAVAQYLPANQDDFENVAYFTAPLPDLAAMKVRLAGYGFDDIGMFQPAAG
jgi:glutamate racemase